MNSAVFDALPGVDTPVDQVRRALAAVWDMDVKTDSGAPSEFRASQMNLVMHFGLDSTSETARAGFETALSFSRRYPCRIIALCPRVEDGDNDLSAKIFCECYIGQSHRDMTCIEAIILSYPLTQRRHLEDQASILLESDLPLYFWIQRVRDSSRIADYSFFLSEANRVVVDSAIEKPGLLSIPWPRPERVFDLTFARTLPLRQSIGHFFSNIPPSEIVSSLKSVELRHGPEFAVEAAVLVKWMRERANDCATEAGLEAPAAPFSCSSDDRLGECLAIDWSYESGREIQMSFDFERKLAELRNHANGHSSFLSSTIRLLPPENALAEALFF